MREPEPGSWLHLRGRMRAMDDIETFVQILDRSFNRFHRGTCGLRVGQNMLNKTIEFVNLDSTCNNIPPRVKSLFVKVKFFMRVRDLNEELKHGNADPNPEDTDGRKPRAATDENSKRKNKSFKTPRDFKKLGEQLF